MYQGSEATVLAFKPTVFVVSLEVDLGLFIQTFPFSHCVISLSCLKLLLTSLS